MVLKKRSVMSSFSAQPIEYHASKFRVIKEARRRKEKKESEASMHQREGSKRLKGKRLTALQINHPR